MAIPNEIKRVVQAAFPLYRGRQVEMVGEGSGRESCTAACLNGKRQCNCHCGGRCHGAGTCHCTES